MQIYIVEWSLLCTLFVKDVFVVFEDLKELLLLLLSLLEHGEEDEKEEEEDLLGVAAAME
jgi:hypothetical protein